MRRSLLLLLLLLLPAAASAGGGRWLRDVTIRGEVGRLRGAGKVNIFLPSGFGKAQQRQHRLLIALHGWSGRGSDWERHSPLTRLADRRGYVIVAPQMGKTVYEREYYPQTDPRYKWGAIPGGRWIGEVVLPYMRRTYNVGQRRERTGIFGLSTGGRGAALVAQYHPEAFAAFAALSGDYDITLMPKEKTCTRIYGPYATFPARWRRDNSRVLLKRLKYVAALLIHGKQDRVCPVQQTRLFARELKRAGYDVTYIEDPRRGHSWKLWAGRLGQVFDFFDEKLR